jgi:lipid-A-disaccharide synthase
MVAGEKSGDLLGAGLIREIRVRIPDAEFFGVGGEAMIAEGFETLADMQLLSVMGLIEPLKRLPALIALRKRLFSHFVAQRPALFVGIDAPDFNLGLEQKLKDAGIKTCHYVCPSVWAWRRGRVKKIARSVDHVLCLLPFEKSFLDKYHIDSTFVGHPIADTLSCEIKAGSENPLQICLMPGSRASEVNALLDIFLQTAQLCLTKNTALNFVLPAATQALYQSIAERLNAPEYAVLSDKLRLVHGNAQHCMRESAAVLIASGTATLEAALLHTPMVVAYKMSTLGFAIASRMVHIDYVALPNLLFGERVVPELLQNQASPENLSAELMRYVNEPEARLAIKTRFSQLHNLLACNANLQAANTVLTLCNEAADSG